MSGEKIFIGVIMISLTLIAIFLPTSCSRGDQVQVEAVIIRKIAHRELGNHFGEVIFEVIEPECVRGESFSLFHPGYGVPGDTLGLTLSTEGYRSESEIARLIIEERRKEQCN